MSDFSTTPSGIEWFETCPRKWAWRYIDGIKPEENKFTGRGKKVHSFIEGWLQKRVPPGGAEESRIAQVMLPFLPPPHLVKPEHVEMNTGIRLSGISFNMTIDLLMPDLDIPTVYDHKTTGDFKWSLTSGTMKDDVQATIYGAWAFVHTKKDRVRVRWTYGLTKGAPRAKQVEQIFTPADIQDRLVNTVRSAEAMRLIYESDCNAVDVPIDAEGCEAYGGCPYRHLCNLTPKQQLESIMSQGTAKADFLNKLRSRNKGAGANGAVNPPEAAQVEEAPEPAQAPAAAAPAAGNKLMNRLRQAPASAPAPEPAAAAAPAAEPAAQRRPGRPAGSSNKPAFAPQEAWSMFATQALQSCAGLEPTLLVEPSDRADIIELAADIADEMMTEYNKRYGGGG